MVGARENPPPREVESESPISSGSRRFAEEWIPPEEFDEYRLVRLLGRGSMGQVYLALDRLLDRPVAIKFISSLHASATERERFFVEARAIARLHHPNIMAIYRVGSLDNNPYLVCEYIQGQCLGDLELPLPWQRVHTIAIGLARGLANAHRHGVLHRDIKLANVMLDEAETVKILDFSLAKLLGDPLRDRKRRKQKQKQKQKQNKPRTPTHTTSQRLPAVNTPIIDTDETADGSPNDDPYADLDTRDPKRNAKDTYAPHGPEHTEHTAHTEPPDPRRKDPPKTPLNPTTAAAGNNALPEPVRARIDALDAAWREQTMLANPADPAAPQSPAVDPGQDTARGDRNLAKAPLWSQDQARLSLTHVGALMGTPHYMAPELWHSEPASRASDVYAVGVVLYALVAGQPPYSALSFTQLATAILAGDHQPLAEAAPAADPRLVTIIERCLRVHPADRYASGEELRSALELLTPGGQRLQIPSGNPFRGLQAFQAEHRSLFFGRSIEIRAVVERLRSDPFVLVAGDSGVGKSSLCRAGVLPLITDGAIEPERAWSTVALLPGRKPAQVLLSTFAEYLDVAEETLHALIIESPVSFGWYLRKQLGSHRGLLLFIDQLEELVTISDRPQAAQVGAVLAQIAAGIPGIRLLASARGDFLTRVAEIPELGEEIARAIYLLRPLSRDGAREAIVGPAALQGARFEPEELVEELVDAGIEGSLPLLQFALAELWNVRDTATNTLSRGDLERIGGVAGALARHGDNTLAALLPEARPLARRLLLRLVTLDDTRGLLTEAELKEEPAGAKTALEALVRARLLVVRETAEGVVYEIAHEALIRGWGTLRRWLDEEREGRILLHSLATAAAEWERLGRPSDGLWGKAALARATLYVDEATLRPRERDFLSASRRAIARGRQLRRLAAVAIPLALATVYGAVKVQEYRAVQTRVEARLSEARGLLENGRQELGARASLRDAAFAAFDRRDPEAGEARWAEVVSLTPTIDRELKDALQALEAALILDPTSAEAHSLLAEVLFERALLAEATHEPKQVAEFRERLALYDDDGRFAARWEAPARLRLAVEPAGVAVDLARYEADARGRLTLGEPEALGVTPVDELRLAPGSYLLRFTRGAQTVNYPVLLGRDEALAVSFALPDPAAIPEGMVYIPPGRFLFGSADDETMRQNFFSAPPLHPVTTEAYLIGRYEVTFAEWIKYLEDLPRDERARRLPATDGVSLEEAAGGAWVLSFGTGENPARAGADEPITFPERERFATQDWLKWPVIGISGDDVRAYAAWLDRSGRLPGARLCTEWEWERASRGADARIFAHGDDLSPEDANHDRSWGQLLNTHGPTERGSFPKSRSPFDIEDLIGNSSEWTNSSVQADVTVLRGGGFEFDSIQARIYNRSILSADFRFLTTGGRICANFSPY